MHVCERERRGETNTDRKTHTQRVRERDREQTGREKKSFLWQFPTFATFSGVNQLKLSAMPNVLPGVRAVYYDEH